MLLLLGAMGLALPARERGAATRDGQTPAPFRVDFRSGMGTVEPDAMLVGDSRVHQLQFPAFARGYAGEGRPPRGMVWSEGGGSVPDMLEHMEHAGVRPRLLVLGASPLSMAMRSFTRAYRAGEDPGIPRLQRWKWWLRDRVLHPLSFLPEERGPVVASRWAERLLPAGAVAGRELGWITQPPRNTVGFRFYFSQEPVPSRETMQATVEAIRRCRRRGTQVVLARLPVGTDMLALENAWGTEGVLGEIAEAAGVRLIDFHALPIYAELKPDILDGSHVQGDEPTRRLSEELGRLVREGGVEPP